MRGRRTARPGCSTSGSPAQSMVSKVRLLDATGVRPPGASGCATRLAVGGAFELDDHATHAILPRLRARLLLAQVVESKGDWSGVGAVFGTVAAAAVLLGALVAWRLRGAGAR